MKVDLSPPYDTGIDIEKVRKILKRVGKAGFKQPKLGPGIIRPVPPRE